MRCGREKPTCQNCIAWKTPCTYSERQKRDNEASRKLVSHNEWVCGGRIHSDSCEIVPNASKKSMTVLTG